jgi:hypothetical protein
LRAGPARTAPRDVVAHLFTFCSQFQLLLTIITNLSTPKALASKMPSNNVKSIDKKHDKASNNHNMNAHNKSKSPEKHNKGLANSRASKMKGGK